MTVLEIILAVCVLVLLLAVIILSVGKFRQHRKISKLADSINEFMLNGKALDFSVDDNELARLQNGIFDLESAVQLEKSKAEQQTKKNIEFISDISHQLKTPIAGLRLYCEIEKSENPNEHTEKELALIEKMEGLVQSLLRLEKLKSDAYSMEMKSCEISDLIRENLSVFYPLFPQKQYILTGSSRMRCDKSWLGEAIGNLIKNASEHTKPDGTVKITVSDSLKSTIIEIHDNGGGIDNDELPNLFTRFYKTKNSSPTGAGIGLAITKAVIEKHHGIISAENKGGGLCVTICLPHLDGVQAI